MKKEMATYAFRCPCCERDTQVTKPQLEGKEPIDCPTEGCGFNELNPSPPVIPGDDDLSGV